MIYTSHFGFKPSLKTLDSVEDVKNGKEIKDAVVGFIHVEAEDAEQKGKVVTKLIKNLKWLAGKNSTKRIVLHSFAHLSERKGDPNLVMEIFREAEQRLLSSGYEVFQTPIGYFVDLELKAPGTPLARVFKQI